MAAREKNMKNTVGVMMIFGMILAAAFSRLIPHAPNLTAITAIALFGGAMLSNRIAAVFVPVVALWITDLFFGFYPSALFVYAAVAILAVVSSFILKNQFRWSKLAGLSLASSLFFFLVTNFGVWMMEAMYPQTWEGLITCYVMALPFLLTQVVGDLFYSGLIFGVFYLLKNRSLQKARGL